MNVSDAIKNRRSIRKYINYKMPNEDIYKILEAGMMAPSAKNTRPWEFVVLESDGVKNKAAEIHPFAKHLKDASIGILVCANIENELVKEMGYYPQDCGAAIQNMLLESLELGYGSCWCGLYPSKDRVNDFKREFSLESIPVALVVVGKANDKPEARGFYEESKVKYL